MPLRMHRACDMRSGGQSVPQSPFGADTVAQVCYVTGFSSASRYQRELHALGSAPARAQRLGGLPWMCAGAA